MQAPMAASRLGSIVHNSPLINRQYATQNQDTDGSRLPTGRCNFTNLSVGGNAPRCGCRRFWDKAATQAGDQVKSGFCMCEHHACYHDDVPEGQSSNVLQASAPDVVMSGGSTTVQNTPLRQSQYPARIQERDEMNRADINMRHESTVPDTAQWSRYVSSGAPSDMSLPAIPSQCLLPSENGSVTSYGGSSYLKPFGGMGLRSLSHIPTPSANAKVQPGQPNAQSEPDLPKHSYEDPHGINFLQSPTEVATPSIRASQDPAESLGKNINSVQEALDNYAERRPHSEIALRPGSKGESVSQFCSGPHLILHNPDDENLLPRIKHVMGQLMDYPNKIQNHEHRLEQLENTSFSQGAIDDLRDDHERVDTRVGELEERVGDLDRQIASINDGSICGRQHYSSVVDCGGSVTSSAMIASAIDKVDSSRIEALEAQVAELQAALPSHARPWEVEVVFLPFGPRLLGIWFSHYATIPRQRLGSTMTDEWTQTQQSMAVMQKALASHDHTSGWEKSATDLDKADHPWLMARACGLGSRVDERLRSRGLVKTVQICGTEARDVQAAIMKAFGDLLDTIADDPYTAHDENSSSVPQALKSYFGLSNPWIPLRKIHKDSCLRYLNPSEMLTPALWTSNFLSSSVAMRHSKIRRLYITHRDAYIQHLSPNHNLTSWTWQKLRQLPRIYPNSSFSQPHTPEADAHEPCWEYDERLDPPHESFHSSISSHISQLSIQPLLSPLPVLVDEFDLEPASPSDHFSSAAVSRHASTTPTSIAPTGHPVSPLKERRERDPFRARPAMNERTISTPVKASGLNAKRRMEGFHYEDADAQIYPSSALNMHLHQTNQAQLKRRRTQSPGKGALFNAPPLNNPSALPQRQQQNRYSAGPPSPYTYIDDIATTISTRERENKGKERERGQTPFAYATPHSNAPYIERERERSGAPISVYEDESVAGDENFLFGRDEEMDEGGGKSVVDEVELDFHTSHLGQKANVEEQEDEEGSIDLDGASQWLLNGEEEEDEEQEEEGHERQVLDADEEFEWEGVGESPGLPIGDVVDADVSREFGEGEGAEDRERSDSAVPSEYPSTLQRKNIAFEKDRGFSRGERGGNERGGFMIHVDEYEDMNEEDGGDDELI